MTTIFEETMQTIRDRARTEPPSAIIATIGEMFPELQEAPLNPWESSAFDLWAIRQAEGARAAARFILSLWSGSRETPWEVGRFDLVDLRDLSEDSRAIIAAWAMSPFWL